MAARAAAESAGLTGADLNFVCYAWGDSADWQAYLEGLYPTPPLNRILKWKKKFYKAKIDPSFNVDSTAVDSFVDGSTQYKSSQTCTDNRTDTSHCSSDGRGSGASQYFSPRPGRDFVPTRLPIPRIRWILSPLCLVGLGVGTVLSFISSIPQSTMPSSTSTQLLLLSFILRIYSTCGTPPLKLWPLREIADSFANSLPYFQHVVLQDSTHAILFLALTSSLSASIPLAIIPGISAVLVAAQILADTQTISAVVSGNTYVRRFKDAVNSKRMALLQMRADIEVYVGILIVISRLITMNFSLTDTVIPVLLYWQLMKIRYHMCAFSRSSIGRIDDNCTRILSHRYCPSLVLTAYQKIRGFCRRQVTYAPESR